VVILRNPSDYKTMSTVELRSEKRILEMIIYIEDFFYIDNLKKTVAEGGTEIINVLPRGYLSRVLMASRIVKGANSRVDIIELELARRADP